MVPRPRPNPTNPVYLVVSNKSLDSLTLIFQLTMIAGGSFRLVLANAPRSDVNISG